MTFHLVHRPEIGPAQSPFRIVQQETGREVAWINRSSIGSVFGVWPTPHFAATPSTCCTSFVGGLAFTTPMPSRRPRSPSRRCSTTLPSSRVSSLGRQRPVSIGGLLSPNKLYAMSFRMPPVSSHPAFTRSTGDGLRWESAPATGIEPIARENAET